LFVEVSEHFLDDGTDTTLFDNFHEREVDQRLISTHENIKIPLDGSEACKGRPEDGSIVPGKALAISTVLSRPSKTFVRNFLFLESLHIIGSSCSSYFVSSRITNSNIEYSRISEEETVSRLKFGLGGSILFMRLALAHEGFGKIWVKRLGDDGHGD
jgi:hypothetical protein